MNYYFKVGTALLEDSERSQVLLQTVSIFPVRSST